MAVGAGAGGGKSSGRGETIDDSRVAPSAPPSRSGEMLVVALECDRPIAGAACHFLGGIDVVRIGRGHTRSATRSPPREAQLDLRLPGRAVSAAHARLVRVGTQWSLQDEGSRNGTFVNGVRTTNAVLAAGDIVEVGRTLLYVEPEATLPGDAPLDCDSENRDSAQMTLHAELASQLSAAARVASARISVLVLGETGTGKEVLARSIHAASGRSGRFVAVNCGALPSQLVEAALFGHVRGAFSGAIRDEPGFVRAADRGTLFLDEIGELPKVSQAALLRVLQEREVTPVGTTTPIAVDLRVVAATNARIREATNRGEFRDDLLARLAGLVVELPPLRSRKRDIGVLIGGILHRISPQSESIQFSTEAGLALLRYAWPHNVRELEQALTTALALSGGAPIDTAHLPAVMRTASQAAPAVSQAPSAWSPREEATRLELLAALAKHRGNVTEVAEAMGKARTQIHRWLRRFGIDPERYRA